MPRRTLAGLSLVAGLAAACAPPPPRLAAWTEPGLGDGAVREDERELWEEAREAAAEIEAMGLLHEDAALQRYLDGVLAALLPEGLAAPAPRPDVRVVRDAGEAAGVTPVGRIFVSTGLLAALDDEAQLAALLSHELAHFLARDSLRMLRYRERTTSTVHRMQRSKEQEYAADRRGRRILQAAGYAGEAMAELLRKLDDADRATRGPVTAWETHPYIPSRIRALWLRRADGPADASERGAARYAEAVADVLLVTAEDELERRRFDRAHALLARHARLRPRSGRRRYLEAEHARLTSDAGRADPAVRAGYEAALELAPDDPDVLRSLGLLLRDRGEQERAERLLTRYLEAAPDALDRGIIERYLE